MTTHRYGQKSALHSLIKPSIVYLGVMLAIILLIWPDISALKGEPFIVLGAFAIWRYSWQMTHFVRAFIYSAYHYPKLRKQALSIPYNKAFPKYIYFVIPSYKEENWVTIECIQSILSNLSDLPLTATLIIATASDEEDELITQVVRSHPTQKKVTIIFQRQKHGKRIAMGYALRAIARRYHSQGNCTIMRIILN